MSSRLLIFPLFLLLCCSLTEPALSLSISQDIIDASRRAHLDPKLVAALISVESNHNPKATSHKGAMGLMQVMPQTADEMGIHQPYHALDNLMGACRYLRKMINRFGGNLRLALAAYNAGPHQVDRYKGIPPFPETQKYVRRVLAKYTRLRARSRTQ